MSCLGKLTYSQEISDYPRLVKLFVTVVELGFVISCLVLLSNMLVVFVRSLGRAAIQVR